MIDVVGWLYRDKIPPFAARQITVEPPIALDSQTAFSALQDRTREQLNNPGKPAPKGTLDNELDDELPW